MSIMSKDTAPAQYEGDEGGTIKATVYGQTYSRVAVAGGARPADGDVGGVVFLDPDSQRGPVWVGSSKQYFRTRSRGVGAVDWGSWGCAQAARNRGGSRRQLKFDAIQAILDAPFASDLRAAGGVTYAVALKQEFNTEGEPEEIELPCPWVILGSDGSALDCGEDLRFSVDFTAPEDAALWPVVPYQFDLVSGNGTRAYIGWCGIGNEAIVDSYPPEQKLRNGPPADTDVTADVWWAPSV